MFDVFKKQLWHISTDTSMGGWEQFAALTFRFCEMTDKSAVFIFFKRIFLDQIPFQLFSPLFIF